jgi:DNA-binding response OmpR family regulator
VREAINVAGSVLEQTQRILIVDDDREGTHLVKVLLEKINCYVVREENDAAKAHESARDFRPDLILLDMMMPQIDGRDIAAQIDADPELQRTPIIFLTALATTAEATAGISFQGHPILAKPINILELINRIEENLPVQITPGAKHS